MSCKKGYKTQDIGLMM